MSPISPDGCRVLALALKPERGGAMQEVTAARACAGGGLAGSARPSAKRGLTFLSAHQWEVVQREIGGEPKPWHTRRANVLLDGGGLAGLIGQRVRVGAAVVDITGETRPCELMDELQPGLRAALDPDLRAGVFGRVIEDGEIHVGDVLRVLGPIPPDSPVHRRVFTPGTD